MTSADFSQFVVTARLLSLKPRLRDLPSYGRTLSGLYPLGLLSAVRIVIGLLLLVQHCPCLSALYQVLVHRANLLPPTSFRFRLTADTLVFGCNLPTIRAVWGLAPVRVRSCWANTKKTPRLRSRLNLCNTINVIFGTHNGNIQAIGELLSYEFCEFLDETISAEIRCHELSVRTYEPV